MSRMSTAKLNNRAIWDVVKRSCLSGGVCSFRSDGCCWSRSPSMKSRRRENAGAGPAPASQNSDQALRKGLVAWRRRRGCSRRPHVGTEGKEFDLKISAGHECILYEAVQDAVSPQLDMPFQPYSLTSQFWRS